MMTVPEPNSDRNSAAAQTLARVAVVCDLVEEKWPSMDLVAEMLLTHLKTNHSDVLETTRVCPPMQRRFSGQWTENGDQRSEIGKRFNVYRFLNRFWDYPRFVRGLKSRF